VAHYNSTIAIIIVLVIDQEYSKQAVAFRAERFVSVLLHSNCRAKGDVFLVNGCSRCVRYFKVDDVPVLILQDVRSFHEHLIDDHVGFLKHRRLRSYGKDTAPQNRTKCGHVLPILGPTSSLVPVILKSVNKRGYVISVMNKETLIGKY